jgi:hypothetical protein
VFAKEMNGVANEKELEKDEKFVVEVKSVHSTITSLQYAIEQYFDGKYGKVSGGIGVSFNDQTHSWHVTTRKGSKDVGYIESVPKAVHELL